MNQKQAPSKQSQKHIFSSTNGECFLTHIKRYSLTVMNNDSKFHLSLENSETTHGKQLSTSEIRILQNLYMLNKALSWLLPINVLWSSQNAPLSKSQTPEIVHKWNPFAKWPHRNKSSFYLSGPSGTSWKGENSKFSGVHFDWFGHCLGWWSSVGGLQQLFVVSEKCSAFGLHSLLPFASFGCMTFVVMHDLLFTLFALCFPFFGQQHISCMWVNA